MIYRYFVLSSIRLVAALLPVSILSSIVSELHDTVIGSLWGIGIGYIFSFLILIIWYKLMQW